MYLYTNAIALQQRHSSTNTLKTRNGHYHWIYTGCVQPNDGLYPKRERLNQQYTTPNWHTESEHVFRICPKFNTLNNFKLYTQSCSRLRIALKCCLSNLTRTSDDFECDLKKKVNAMEPKCSIDKLWYVFHWKCDDTTSTAHHFKKLKKYALAPNSTNRLTIISDEFYNSFLNVVLTDIIMMEKTSFFWIFSSSKCVEIRKNILVLQLMSCVVLQTIDIHH